MRKFSIGALLAVALVGLTALPSSAAVDNSVVTGVTTGFTDVTSFLTTNLIPALMGLIVIGIAVVVGVKYLRRGSSKA